MEGMNFAAIDIGTNAARLLIKNIDHNPLGETKFRKVLFIRYPLRLGMDVFSKGKIGKERAEMMMRMIKGFKQMMRMYDVVDYRACATSAMRDAKNGKALIKKIEKKTGIRIDLIEGKEEAGILYGNHIEKLPNKEGTFMYDDTGYQSYAYGVSALDDEYEDSEFSGYGYVQLPADAVRQVNAKDGANVEVYSLHGVLLARSREEMLNLNPGIYILRTEDKAVKIVVK